MFHSCRSLPSRARACSPARACAEGGHSGALTTLCEALLGEPPSQGRPESEAFACEGVEHKALLKRVLAAIAGSPLLAIQQLAEEMEKAADGL